jgi:predicted ATPase/class 3 adenylate cyclase
MRCSKCGSESPAGKKFCGDCGASLTNRCPKCDAENPPGKRFCGDCGTTLAGSSASVQSPTSSLGKADIVITAEPTDSAIANGERKRITALFADIKGSTELMRELDPEEARGVIDPALHIMMGAVHRYDGYVVQSTGDGIFALFGAPLAHEDHPQRGLYAALQMQQELREYGRLRTAQGAHTLDARVGINTGEVVVRPVETGGRIEYTPIGHTANLASRLQTLAPIGSIAVSEYTRTLCEGYFELRALGPMAVRGISEPVNVYEVTGLGSLRTHFHLSARRGLTKFVGRGRELEQMQRALELAMSGHGQVFAVMAEAGTGKSRLFYEFKATLPPACKVLEAYSVSHGKASAWLPVLELLRDYFGIQEADEPARRREKVRIALVELDPALQDLLPYMFGLLGIVEDPDPLAQMDPQVKRQRMLDAIKRLILRESVKQPLVVTFEDLHWIDEQTQAFLDLLVDSGGSGRVLLLVNYRPEYRHEWGNKSNYVQLRLNPLGRESAEELLTALLGDADGLQPLKRLIIERTGGNPFFIEEMVQALFDERILVRNGIVKVTRSLSQVRVPPTVQGILAARIDRLAGEQKELLQTLAVIGRESPLGLIRQVVSTEARQLESMLADLQAAEFIYDQPSTSGVEYVFKHALTQEVAYNSLLIERRKLLHERTGHVLESMSPDQLDDHLSQLAHHYSHSDNVDKAVEYLGRAGQQAMERSAHAAAINSLSAAINLLQRLPDSLERIRRELLLQLALSPALIAIKDWSAPEVERAYTHARRLCERLGDPSELFPVLFGLYTVHYVRGEMRPSYDLAEQLLQRAQNADDPMLLMFAHLALGFTSYQMGELLLARHHIEIGISLYDRKRHRPVVLRFTGIDSEVQCLSYLAYALWTLGYPEQALNRVNEAVGLAQASSHSFSLAFAELFTGFVYLFRREARAAQAHGETVIALCAEYGFTGFVGHATVLCGGAMAQQGCYEEGIRKMREGLATNRVIGTKLGLPDHLSRMAEAFMETDRFDDGLSALAEAEAAADENEDRQHEAERHRIKGELMLRQDDSRTIEAEHCFRWLSPSGGHLRQPSCTLVLRPQPRPSKVIAQTIEYVRCDRTRPY